jgi:hypothetical protein
VPWCAPCASAAVRTAQGGEPQQLRSCLAKTPLLFRPYSLGTTTTTKYDYSRLRAFAAFILEIAVIARQRRKQRRRDARAYLTRPSLPPVPRADSAWAYLYSARLDKIVTMGVDGTLLQILAKKYNWYERALSHTITHHHTPAIRVERWFIK